MKTFYRLILVSLLISPLGISQPLGAQTIGVSIPAATHGWTGGLNFHAEETKNRLEAANPSLRIVLLLTALPNKQMTWKTL